MYVSVWLRVRECVYVCVFGDVIYYSNYSTYIGYVSLQDPRGVSLKSSCLTIAYLMILEYI